MLAQVAIAASLAAPVLGTPLRETDSGAGPAAGPTTFRDPATLKRLRGTAKLPAFSTAEPSPRGGRVAVADGRRLTVRALRSGRRVVRLRTPKPVETMLWTRRNRLITVQCGRRLDACWLRTYNPRNGCLVRRAKLPAPIVRYFDRVSVDKVGRRYVVWTHSSRGGATRAVIVDRRGRVRHTVRVGSTDAFAGQVAVSGRGAWSVDVRTGRKRFRPRFEGDEEVMGPAIHGRTASGDVWAVGPNDARMVLLDAKTLATKETTGPIPGEILITPTGYLVRGDPPGATLRAYTNAGDLRWEVPDSGLRLGTIGDYVYSQEADDLSSDRPRRRVVVRSLATGETLAVREGAMRLVTSGGRSALNVDTGLRGDAD